MKDFPAVFTINSIQELSSEKVVTLATLDVILILAENISKFLKYLIKNLSFTGDEVFIALELMTNMFWSRSHIGEPLGLLLQIFNLATHGLALLLRVKLQLKTLLVHDVDGASPVGVDGQDSLVVGVLDDLIKFCDLKCFLQVPLKRIKAFEMLSK